MNPPNSAWDIAEAAVREEGGIALRRSWALRATPEDIGCVFVKVAVVGGGDDLPSDTDAGELGADYVGEVVGMLLAFAHRRGLDLADVLAEALRYRKDAIS